MLSSLFTKLADGFFDADLVDGFAQAASRRVVRIIIYPRENRVIAAECCFDNLRDDAQSIVAVGQDDHTRLLFSERHHIVLETAIISPVPEGIALLRMLQANAESP